MPETLTYLKDVTTLQLNADLCVGCEMCMIVCPHEVLVVENGRAEIADRDSCMECGACAQNCPTGALSVEAGVGCASAVINSALGRTGESSGCCCVAETTTKGGPSCGPGCC